MLAQRPQISNYFQSIIFLSVVMPECRRSSTTFKNLAAGLEAGILT
jgi:hypothetical protein